MSAPRRGVYKRVGERIKEGDYSSLIDPLDFLLIEALPDEGTNVANLYQVGETAASLAKKFNTPSITSQLLGVRLGSLKRGELVRPVKMVGGRGNFAWQRTELGKEVVEKWRSQQNPA